MLNINKFKTMHNYKIEKKTKSLQSQHNDGFQLFSTTCTRRSKFYNQIAQKMPEALPTQTG